MERIEISMSRTNEKKERQIIRGHVIISTNDEYLDRRILHMYHHLNLKVSELLGDQKLVDSRMRIRRHDNQS